MFQKRISFSVETRFRQKPAFDVSNGKHRIKTRCNKKYICSGYAGRLQSHGLWFGVRFTKIGKKGFEIGFHTNFLEFATYTKLDPLSVLSSEYKLLSSIYSIKGVSCHRDINYQVNSLPYLQENWETIKEVTRLQYDAYDENIFGGLIYVNEGLNPHLNWRNYTPLEMISQKNLST